MPSVVCRAEKESGFPHDQTYISGPIIMGKQSSQVDPVTAASADKFAKPVDRSKGLWTRCEKCGVILYIKHLKVREMA